MTWSPVYFSGGHALWETLCWSGSTARIKHL